MEDKIFESKDELKRADHLIYVSLKYTRTCDVIKSVFHRLINAIDAVATGLLEKAEAEHKIFEVPTAPGLKADQLKQVYDDKKIHEMMDFYIFLRKLNNAEFTRSNEYRRHVTLTAFVGGEEHGIKIETVTEWYHTIKDFVDYISSTYR